jgi:small-conductance mechanosensitive channel
MKSKLLFPNQFKRIGWIILIPSAILGILDFREIVNFKFLEHVKVFAFYSSWVTEPDTVFGVETNNISNEIFGILCIIGAILVAFSKEKQEDEFIAKTRLESLVWATYINYAILVFCTIFFYGFSFMYILIFNMFAILIFFIIRFYYTLYKSKKSLSYEK